MVSESIIANHACASLVRGENIRGFVLTAKSTKILPLENFPLYGISSCDWKYGNILIYSSPLMSETVALEGYPVGLQLHTPLILTSCVAYLPWLAFASKSA